jgi:hypothetical protein
VPGRGDHHHRANSKDLIIKINLPATSRLCRVLILQKSPCSSRAPRPDGINTVIIEFGFKSSSSMITTKSALKSLQTFPSLRSRASIGSPNLCTDLKPVHVRWQFQIAVMLPQPSNTAACPTSNQLQGRGGKSIYWISRMHM